MVDGILNWPGGSLPDLCNEPFWRATRNQPQQSAWHAYGAGLCAVSLTSAATEADACHATSGLRPA